MRGRRGKPPSSQKGHVPGWLWLVACVFLFVLCFVCGLWAHVGGPCWPAVLSCVLCCAVLFVLCGFLF